jgi:hypothetical protein
VEAGLEAVSDLPLDADGMTGVELVDRKYVNLSLSSSNESVRSATLLSTVSSLHLA